MRPSMGAVMLGNQGLKLNVCLFVMQGKRLQRYFTQAAATPEALVVDGKAQRGHKRVAGAHNVALKGSLESGQTEGG